MNYQTNSCDITIQLTDKHTLFTLSNLNDTGLMKHSIASLYFIKYNILIDTSKLVHNLEALSASSLNIFYISNDPIYKNELYNYNNTMLLAIRILQLNLKRRFQPSRLMSLTIMVYIFWKILSDLKL